MIQTFKFSNRALSTVLLTVWELALDPDLTDFSGFYLSSMNVGSLKKNLFYSFKQPVIIVIKAYSGFLYCQQRVTY